MLRVEDGCNGRSTRAVTDRFTERYRRREAAIRARLEPEHGPAALDAAEEIHVHPSCGDDGGRSHYWRARYESVLATLEQRFAIDRRVEKPE